MYKHFEKNKNNKITPKAIVKMIIWISLSILLVCYFFNVFINVEKVPTDTISKPTKSIAVIQTVAHVSLDQAYAGIKNALCKNGYQEDVNLKIVYQSAQGNAINASQIIQQFMAQNPDVIVAIGTPAAKAALIACRTANIPVVYSSVTDTNAGGLIHDQMTGSLDYPNLQDNLDLIKQFVPTIKKLGIIYSAAEDNSIMIVNEMRALVKKYGLELVESSINNSTQVSSAVDTLIGNVDAIYLPSDSTVFSAINVVVKASLQNNIPVFSNDPDSVRSGVLAGIGFDQIDVGYLTGEYTAQILDGIAVKSLPKRTPYDSRLYINKTTFDALNTSLQFKISDQTIVKASFVQ